MNKLGQFPADGQEARKSGKFYKLTSDTALKVVSGTKTPVLLNMFVSNDVMSVGELVIPAGGIGPRQTEFDVHDGDAVFYVKEGPLTFFFKESKEVFYIEDGDFAFIPKGYEYKVINYSGKVAKAVFVVAPKL
ncbi:MAG: cupin domain-containing protein [Eubacteriales bacterium]|nr:cupin domain-containing protein [Eubacteriales bacterium]